MIRSTIKKIKPIRVRGIGNQFQYITHSGTVRWVIEDDSGTAHEILIKGALFGATLGMRLLSPQHWAQQANDHLPKQKGTRVITDDHEVTMQWKQRSLTKTIPLSKTSNIAILRTAGGFSQFRAFAASFDDDLLAFRHEFTSVHDQGLQVPPASGAHPPTCQPCTPTTASKSPAPPVKPPDPKLTDSLNLQNFHVSETLMQEIHEEQEQATDGISPRSIAYWWHCRLGHLPLARLKMLAHTEQIPKCILKVQELPCAACIYGKQTRRPWRGNQVRRTIFPAKAPGDCVSVDQLKSTTAGFVAQLKGILTKKRYHVSTVFTDHFSDLSYVHFSTSDTALETLAAKQAFEIYASSHGVTIKHYHCDNGRFAENLFTESCKQSKQRLTFCPVNQHNSNGRAEKRNRDLQDGARTNMLHAKSLWPAAINTHLWPYALKFTNDVRNQVPQATGRTPLIQFSGSNVQPKLQFHTFGCPVYTLDSKLASGKTIPKWDSRGRLGIYIGQSPAHSRTVALVLNPVTGLVSPQFHVRFDDTFATLKQSSVIVHWIKLAGFGVEKASVLPSAKKPMATLPNTTPIQAAGEEEIDEQQELANAPEVHFEQDDNDDDDIAQEPNAAPVAEPDDGRRRSGRTRQPSRIMRDLRDGENVAFIMEVTDDQMDEFQAQQALSDPIAFKAKSDPDTLYYHEAMQADDREQFTDAMIQEINSHNDNEHWELMLRKDVPKCHKILSAIWAMRRKRRIATGEIYKWKARINVHGGQQIKGVHYEETYSPVVGWASIRTALLFSQTNNWHTRQIDFVLAFPQADVGCEMYMEVPRGFVVTNGDRSDYCLKLKKNLYGSKNAGLVFHEHLKRGLSQLGFVQSKVDEGVFYRGKMMFLIYVDDGILIHPDKKEIDKVIEQLRKLKYNISDEGDISDYLGVKVEKLANGNIKLSQPQMIRQIVKDLGFNERTITKSLPALSSKIILRDEEGEPFKEQWEYRSVIGKLNFLEKSTRPEIAYAVHQCARFMSDPKDSHAQAIKQIGRYLLATADKGIILSPRDQSFECYADADFSGNWNQATAMLDPSTARSRSGWVITFAGCPIVWASKLQTEIALSTAESELICLSQALREVIPLMEFFKEIKEQGITHQYQTPTVYCKLFEDNSAALEIARVPKMRPRTKHINIKYHHFRQHVKSGQIKVLPIDTKDQITDIFTKPLPFYLFNKFRELLLKWSEDDRIQVHRDELHS